MTDRQDLYERQENLDLNPPESVTVIGVGGIGSWVALDLALAGVQRVNLVDPDVIENHNLNRTPFKSSQVEKPKVQAVSELIAERRPSVDTYTFQDRVEDVSPAFTDEIADSVVVDCRDHASPLPDFVGQTLLTAGYDGMEYTLHLKPDYDAIWGDADTEYETVPSFLAPPQFMASVITAIACSTDLLGGIDADSDAVEEKVSNGSLTGLIAEEFIDSDSDSEESEGDTDE